jgi:uncharacterized lipoprotein YajG
MRKLNYFVFLSLLIAGCAYAKQVTTIRNKPLPIISCTNKPNGKSISLAVTDDRKNKKINKKGNDPATEDEVMKTFTGLLQQDFTVCGYKVTLTNNVSAARVAVSLRSLSYSNATGYYTSGSHLKTSAKVTVKSPGKADWFKMFREDEENQRGFADNQNDQEFGSDEKGMGHDASHPANPPAQKKNQWLANAFTDLAQSIALDPPLNAQLGITPQ